jgi:cytidyltransferase-related domain
MNKIYDIQYIKEFIDSIREQKTVLTCGCFDIFHIGHLEHLIESSKFGDILIVGVNSDESYKLLKKSSPLFSAKERMSILEALECVDYVFQFPETTCCKSLEYLLTNVFTAGIDKKDHVIEEQKICEIYNIVYKCTGERKAASSSYIKSVLMNNE